jgi:Holliday junction resolvase-like predicted endonuclease
MGNKIITEKDFWICTGGTTPAQLQSTQLSAKKDSGHKYITVADTATSSWIDFGCRKLMWIMAILAAVIVVAVVATGGAALGVLIAAGAIAGAAGAAFGAVVGALICGQKAAAARKWLSSKPDMIIQGRRAITGDDQMKCMLFGETIAFAPQIKNWWQAVSLGASNYLGGILEGAMYGAAIGAAGGVISGGPAVLGQFGVSNVAANWLATWGGWGLGLRGLVTTQSVLGAYGNTGQVTADDVVTKGIFGMETGTLHSAQNILSGNGTMTDLIGVGLWFIPAHGGSKETRETRTRNEEARNEEARDEEARNEENPQSRGNESEAPRQEGEFDAFEEGRDLGNNRVGSLGEQAVIDRLTAEGYTEILQIQNNSGHGVDIIARNPLTGEVKAVEVKANQSRLSEDQAEGGEWYVEDRLRRAANGERGYGVPPNPPELPTNARTAQQWIEDAPRVDYEVHRVDVDRVTGEAGSIDVSPWDPVNPDPVDPPVDPPVAPPE